MGINFTFFFIKMKIFSVLFFAASVSASTLLSPLYDMAAQQVIDTARGILAGIKGELEALNQPTNVITEFETALNGLSNQAVVDVLKQIPIETILEGGLTAEDFAKVFENTDAMAGIDFSALNQEFIANLDNNTIAQFEQAMDAMVDAAASIQEVFDSEITLSNFVGVVTDILDAFDRLDGVFGFSTGTTDIIRDILMWTSVVVEKALYAFENYHDYLYMLEDAVLLTELEFERRIKSVEVCTDGFNAVNYAIDATKFAGTVVIDNWSEPVKETADIWNTLVGNVPYLDDWQIPTSVLTTVEWYVQMIVDSIEGSLIELRVLLLPLRSVIDGTVKNWVC